MRRFVRHLARIGLNLSEICFADDELLALLDAVPRSVLSAPVVGYTPDAPDAGRRKGGAAGIAHAGASA